MKGKGSSFGIRFPYKKRVRPEFGYLSRRDLENGALSMLLMAVCRSCRLQQAAGALATLFDDMSRFDDDTTWIEG
jgi:hypothetical protein